MTSAKGRRKAFDEIYDLKIKQRNDIIKCILCTVVVVAFVLADQLLSLQGIIDAESSTHSIVTFMVVIILAIIGGMASMDYTKQKNAILEIQRTTGITDADIKEYMHS